MQLKPNRIIGVDFSGGKDAGRKIWIASAAVEGDLLRFEMCSQASTLPGSSVKRDLALPALRAFILQQAPCIVGLDFPFGLPGTLVAEDRWEDFVVAFSSRFRDAEAFRDKCWQAASGKELRRVTDRAAGTPFSPYNLRLYRQTYYGIRDVLAQLATSDRVSVLPMQTAVSGRAWLLEICPASTLKEMGLYHTYKDAKTAPVRDAILTSLKHSSTIMVPENLRTKILEDKDGDALDSVIAAVATFRALRDSIVSAEPGSPAAIEGYVYV